MPNVMAALPCSCRHLWKFRIRHKVWLTPTDGVPCSNTANIAKRKTWTQSEFCTLQNSVRGQEPPKVYIVPAQETAKHPAKFGWPPLSDVGAVTKWRRETGWNLLGCPKLPNRSQPLVGRSSPCYEDMWRRYCCLTSFFSDCRYVPSLRIAYIARQMCAMVPGWRIFWRFLCPVLLASRVHCSMFQTCISN